ncbi:MAG: hypothetical protein LPK09_11535 [Hymenobacteraceae bacterium]|nr:hypothetical protein [Hymenobacteraceae bacterium]
MKPILTLLFVFLSFLFLVNKAIAQKLSYGPTAGLLFDNPTGSVLLDSLQVILQGDNDRRPYLGAYVSYKLSDVFSITSGANYYNAYTSAIMYNVNKEGFGRLVNSTSAGNRSIEIPFQVDAHVPFLRVNTFLLAGISPNIRITRYASPYHTGRYISPYMSEALYQFRTVMKPVVWKYTLGVGASIWRLRLEAKWQQDLSESATRPYKVWGKSYDFYSKNSVIRFGIGYNLNWKNKE